MPVSEDFKRKIYAIRDLPTLPIIAQKILTLRNDDETLAEKLGTIISSDQSLSVKVLTLQIPRITAIAPRSEQLRRPSSSLEQPCSASFLSAFSFPKGSAAAAGNVRHSGVIP